jgi:hypothetical protein
MLKAMIEQTLCYKLKWAHFVVVIKGENGKQVGMKDCAYDELIFTIVRSIICIKLKLSSTLVVCVCFFFVCCNETL